MNQFFHPGGVFLGTGLKMWVETQGGGGFFLLRFIFLSRLCGERGNSIPLEALGFLFLLSWALALLEQREKWGVWVMEGGGGGRI